ncbi:hypothetical protein BG842_24275 [Haladaptatus sp. W1]|uniref:LVIVD repeat-containing protein n=1 Tax=Haladaptatus sp. W1 TaxID=1897478 RepID=UPI000849D24F|nr:hypothetical protein [Haladaptatus sp. W1]ODR81921.1 hypothetical protein BG842_24275 [Haladaptatus sp. W1]
MHRREFLRTAAVGGGAASLFASGGVVSDGVADTEAYRPLGRVAITNAKEAVVGNDGKTAFVATTDGFATVDIRNPKQPTVMAERHDLLAQRDGGPLLQIWDAKVDGDRLLVAGPANPIGSDAVHGVLLYDVRDPTDPKRVAFHETTFPIHNAFLKDDIAYLTGNDGDGNPLVLVDVSNDSPTEVGRWSMVDYDEDWGDVDSWVRTLHDVWVHDGRAYLAQWDAGTWVVDVSDPKRPTHVSHFGGRSPDDLASIPSSQEQEAVIGLPGNAHFVMTNEDASLLACNKEAWDTDGPDTTGPGGIDLWDISDVTTPRKLTTIRPPKTDDPSYDFAASLSSVAASLSPVGVASGHDCHECGQGSSATGWTTSHNFDFVGDRLYTSWYSGGVKLFDVSDPANPTELAWWRKPSEAAFWTAQRVSGDVFIGGSMGQEGDGRGGLYTFPNRGGQQRNPPSLTGTGTASETTTSKPVTGGDGTTDSGDGGTSLTKEGRFGAGVAGLSILGAGVWKRFRGQN